MDASRKSNKIRDIVRLQQLLKKWKKAAHNNSTASVTPTNTATAATTTTTTTTTTPSLARSASVSGSKSIKFLKKTLSFSETSSTSPPTNVVPKGYMAVCVGQELKRFVIPTEYLGHQAFGVLLREAEEEFGFQQEGVLKFPCEVDLFERILKMMETKRLSTSSASSAAELLALHDDVHKEFGVTCGTRGYSPDQSGLGSPSLAHHPQMCR